MYELISCVKVLTHKIVRVASSTAAVDQLGAVAVSPRELHAWGPHSGEREPHPLVDAVHRLQERAEVAPRRANHGVVAEGLRV